MHARFLLHSSLLIFCVATLDSAFAARIRPKVTPLPQTTTGSITYLSDLDLRKMQQGYGEPQADSSVTSKPLSLAGKTYERGVGTHAASTMWIDVGGAKRFDAIVGVDDSAGGAGSVIFRVYGDGRKLWQSDVLRHKGETESPSIPLDGINTLLLRVESADRGINHDHADWADARFIVNGEAPKAIDPPGEAKAEILTPPPGPQPRINGPKVYGCRPGNPFLYRIPATGTRPMQFQADKLPESLKLDAATGIISGTAPPRGEHKIKISATNFAGTASRAFRIVSGDKLALTPYMGWNHWYMHYDKITDALMRQAADALISSGMADAGYDYVCIDDCWMNAPNHEDPKRVGPLRDENGIIKTNTYFPDMKSLTDYIHAKGFKAGIYTSPGPFTCGGFAGSYEHEAQDAETFAQWGFDLLKHDWCSYGKLVPKPTPLPELQKPYMLMGELLLKQKRDIIYNLCQYGMGDVWEWGEQVHAQSWRTSGDLGYELNNIFNVAATNARHRAWNGPGTWNDPDYIQIGMIGDLRANRQAKRGVLTPTEEYSFMSLWCLSAAPLVYSGDMRNLDAFTTAILCNPEVIKVNQDPLGQCASINEMQDDTYVMVKELEDGSKAVGLCNGGEFEVMMTARWPVVGIQGKHHVRDLWRHKDLGVFENEFSAKVPRHGVVMVKITESALPVNQ